MTEIKLGHKMSIKMCKKCGKGHDLSAITCAKPRGIDEEREVKPCTGKLQIIQFDTFFLDEYTIVKNK